MSIWHEQAYRQPPPAYARTQGGSQIRVAVLVDAQSTTGVLRKDVHDAGLRKFRQLAHYLARHQMEAATFRLQGYFNLLYHLTKLSTILLDT